MYAVFSVIFPRFHGKFSNFLFFYGKEFVFTSTLSSISVDDILHSTLCLTLKKEVVDLRHSVAF